MEPLISFISARVEPWQHWVVLGLHSADRRNGDARDDVSAVARRRRRSLTALDCSGSRRARVGLPKWRHLRAAASSRFTYFGRAYGPLVERDEGASDRR
jgi:hypothetical protein